MTEATRIFDIYVICLPRRIQNELICGWPIGAAETYEEAEKIFNNAIANDLELKKLVTEKEKYIHSVSLRRNKYGTNEGIEGAYQRELAERSLRASSDKHD